MDGPAVLEKDIANTIKISANTLKVLVISFKVLFKIISFSFKGLIVCLPLFLALLAFDRLWPEQSATIQQQIWIPENGFQPYVTSDKHLLKIEELKGAETLDLDLFKSRGYQEAYYGFWSFTTSRETFFFYWAPDPENPTRGTIAKVPIVSGWGLKPTGKWELNGTALIVPMVRSWNDGSVSLPKVGFEIPIGPRPLLGAVGVLAIFSSSFLYLGIRNEGYNRKILKNQELHRREMYRRRLDRK